MNFKSIPDVSDERAILNSILDGAPSLRRIIVKDPGILEILPQDKYELLSKMKFSFKMGVRGSLIGAEVWRKTQIWKGIPSVRINSAICWPIWTKTDFSVASWNFLGRHFLFGQNRPFGSRYSLQRWHEGLKKMFSYWNAVSSVTISHFLLELKAFWGHVLNKKADFHLIKHDVLENFMLFRKNPFSSKSVNSWLN